MDSAQHSVNPRVLVRGGDLKKKENLPGFGFFEIFLQERVVAW